MGIHDGMAWLDDGMLVVLLLAYFSFLEHLPPLSIPCYAVFAVDGLLACLSCFSYYYVILVHFDSPSGSCHSNRECTFLGTSRNIPSIGDVRQLIFLTRPGYCNKIEIFILSPILQLPSSPG